MTAARDTNGGMPASDHSYRVRWHIVAALFLDLHIAARR